MGEDEEHLARLRRQVGVPHALAGLALRKALEQALELADIAVDRAPEAWLGLV